MPSRLTQIDKNLRRYAGSCPQSLQIVYVCVTQGTRCEVLLEISSPAYKVWMYVHATLEACPHMH